jgi:hypothetical protein
VLSVLGEGTVGERTAASSRIAAAHVAYSGLASQIGLMVAQVSSMTAVNVSSEILRYFAAAARLRTVVFPNTGPSSASQTSLARPPFSTTYLRRRSKYG